MGRAFDELGVTWFEEPVSSDDLAGLRQVRSQITADVAAGEYVWSLVEAQRMVAAQAVDCLQADATRCGGYTEWLRIAAVAAAHNLQVSGHCAPALHAPRGCRGDEPAARGVVPRPRTHRASAAGRRPRCQGRRDDTRPGDTRARDHAGAAGAGLSRWLNRAIGRHPYSRDAWQSPSRTRTSSRCSRSSPTG